jgi:sugar phosphate isomerase/epimerase
LFFHFGRAQEEVLFFQTNWGYEGEISDFIKKAKDSGYDGVEIWSNTDPDEKKIVADLLKSLI